MKAILYDILPIIFGIVPLGGYWLYLNLRKVTPNWEMFPTGA